MSDLDLQLQESARLMALLHNDFQLYGKVTQKTADAIAAGSSDSARRLDAAGKSAAAGLDQLASGATAFTRSLYQGEQGMKGMNGVMDGLGGAANEFGTALMVLGGPFGIAAGILLKLVAAATKAAKVVGEHADKQFDVYQKLGRIGATASDGMKGTTQAAYKLGYNISNLDEFVRVIEKNSQSLALVAGGAAQGRDAFAQLGDTLKGERQNFLMLGININNLNEGLAGFINLQVQTGQGNSMTVQSLADAARDYVYEQDILTRITGQTREATESARKKALEEERFLAVVRKADREKAGSGQALIKLNDMVEASFRPEISKGVRDLMTGFGRPTDEARKVMMSGNTELVGLLRKFREGSISQIELVDRMRNNVNRFATTHGEAIGLLGQGGKDVISGADQSRSLAEGQTAMAEREAGARKDQADAKKGDVDKTILNQAELEQKSRDTKEKIDKAVDEFIGPLSRAMVSMLNVVDDLIDGIKSLVGWFSRKEPEQRRATQDSVAVAQLKLTEAQAKYNQERERLGQETNEAALKAGEEMLKVLEIQVKASQESLESEKKLMAEGTAEERRARRRAQREQGVAYPEPTRTDRGQSGAAGAAGAAPVKPGTPATNTSDQAGKLIAQFEGFSPKAYKDHSQFSIGYGTRTDDPEEIAGRKTIDQAEGVNRLTSFVNKIVPQVVAAGRAKQWGQNQVDAMASFAYNLGPGAIAQVTDGGKRTNQETADAMLKYNKAGGEALPGLTNRRQAERALFLRDMPMLAEGGIATRPSIAGEAGPEAVIPITNGRVPVDLTRYAGQLESLMPDQEDTKSGTLDPKSQDFDIDLDQVVQQVANEIMTTNDVEGEMLDLLQFISRANRDTVDNNRKFYRSQYS